MVMLIEFFDELFYFFSDVIGDVFHFGDRYKTGCFQDVGNEVGILPPGLASGVRLGYSLLLVTVHKEK
jgi:hypothetical protein